MFTFKICSSEELSKIAETPLWVTDIALGTRSWLVVRPIMAFGLLQGIAGTLAIAYMSKSILRPLRDDPVTADSGGSWVSRYLRSACIPMPGRRRCGGCCSADRA